MIFMAGTMDLVLSRTSKSVYRHGKSVVLGYPRTECFLFSQGGSAGAFWWESGVLGEAWGSIGNREACFEGKMNVRIFRLLFKDRTHDDSTSESGGHRGDYGVSGADLEDFVCGDDFR
jgi:hypothetical protein